MRLFSSVAVCGLLVGLVACSSSSSPTPDSGVIVTPDAGTAVDAGPQTSLVGLLSFSPVSAATFFAPTAGGGLNQNEFSFMFSNLTQEQLCVALASGSLPTGSYFEGFMSFDGGAVPGTFHAGYGATVVETLRFDMDGGHQTFFAEGLDGGLTIDQIQWPTALGGGWYSGGEVDGAIGLILLDQSNGISSGFGGPFAAPGCPYAPLGVLQ